MPRQRCENCQVKRQSNDELSGMILWMISLPMRCMSPKLVDLDDVLMAVEMRNREVREREKGEKEFVNL